MMDKLAKGEWKWLFFDVGSTLVDETESFRLRVVRTVATQKEHGIDCTEEFLWDAMRAAAREGRSYFRGAMRSIGIVDFPPYDPTGEVLFPDVKAVLEALAKRYSLGIIANQPRGTADRLKEYGVGHLFSLVLSSEEEGVEKPNEEIFLRALRRAGCEPHEACMIGDRPDNDIAPAKRLGMKTIRITQGLGGLMPVLDEDCRADQTVSSLSEMISVIDFLK